ncbi:MAG: N-acetylmuramoyl-L-alanine amidase family protein [Blautia sp.]|jgi:glucan-binding YG repeat protein
MQKHVSKRSGLWIFAFILILFAGVFLSNRTVIQTQAAVQYYNKLVWIDGERYYYNSSGKKVTSSWVTVGKYKYYFGKDGKAIREDWIKSGDNYYYVNKNGAMYENRQVKIDDKYYYFDDGGTMHRGWLEKGAYWYFYSKENGARVSSWQTIDDIRYYFYSSGRMATGWVKSGKGNYYYFAEEGKYSNYKEGQLYKSWLTYNGRKYYMRPSTGMMVKDGTYSIGGKEYTFDKYGVLNGDGKIEDPEAASGSFNPSSAKTLKNFMLNAMLPVGKCAYVWGGGHDYSDSTRKGVSSAWEKHYNTMTTSSDRSKGLDCSGFVGWAVYNVMNTKSGGENLTGVSGTMLGDYASRGWGVKLSQSYMSSQDYRVRCGDIGGDASHIWIVLGQCEDMSAVIVHSSTNGVQLAGTPVPTTGNSSSQAQKLAAKYMSQFTKYNYSGYTGSNYLRRAPYFRWNLTEGPMKDPDNYRNMSAEQILKDIFGY